MQLALPQFLQPPASSGAPLTSFMHQIAAKAALSAQQELMDAMGMSEEECLQRLLSHNPQAELPPPPTKAGGIKSKSKVTFASPLELKPQPTLDTKQRGKAVLVVPSVNYRQGYT